MFMLPTREKSSRQIAPGGIITTVAGNGRLDAPGDGGTDSEPEPNRPSGLLWTLQEISISRIRRIIESGKSERGNHQHRCRLFWHRRIFQAMAGRPPRRNSTIRME